MKYFVWGLVVLLLLLHQDYWQWNDTTLLFGWLPYTLAYHVMISLGAAAVWVMAVRFCWPADLDAASEGGAEGEERP